MRFEAGSRLKFAVFSVLPAVLLFGSIELVFRLAGLDEPLVRSRPLPGEQGGLLRLDPELFWSVAPDVVTSYEGAPVRTNALGLRGGEVPPRSEGELRILSLGESSTFGVGVGNDETYTARLAPLLERALRGRRVTALNAGVPAWSSFQSLRYLETRGLDLEPDVLLVYHEVNDYLPSSLRDSSNNEIGVTQTDAELHASRLQALNRLMIRYSGIYRYFVRRRAYREIRGYDTSDFESPLLEIGMPTLPINSRLFVVEGDARVDAGVDESALGRRVSDAERWANFERFDEIATREGIALVLIHPTYQATLRHGCMLGVFAAQHGVRLFETYDLLHTEGGPPWRYFLDTMHPTAEGHERLARGLAEFLLDSGALQRGGRVAGLN